MCGSDDESRPCKGFDLPDQPNVSFRSTPLSIITWRLADISYQLPKTDAVVMKLSRCGASLYAPPPDGMLCWA